MKQKLLFFILLSVTFFRGQANSNPLFALDPPTATMAMDQTICPGNSATITITGTPNCIATITSSNSSPATFTVGTGVSGTAIYTTPILNQTTVYTLVEVRNFNTLETTAITGVSVTITVIPNGCATVLTNINVTPNDLAICNSGECRTLEATTTAIPATTTYTVSSIPYCPQAAFTDPGYNQINIVGQDDIWSAPIALPFNFSFFNENYTSCQVGTNGVITFNPQTAPGFCPWDINNLQVPSVAFPIKNAIFGVYQDTDERTDTAQSPASVSVNWKLTGTYPCRKLVVNFYNVGQFNCNQSVGLQTYQIVLYEISNIIEVYIEKRTPCTSWRNGAGVVGIINNTGAMAYTPSERNTGAWSATNEAWRFTPNGPNVAVFIQWLENGNVISSGATAIVCPAVTTTYTAQAHYNISGMPFTVNSQPNTIIVRQDMTQIPVDLTTCYNEMGIYTADLTVNTAIMLGAVNPADYEVDYFTSLADAENYSNPITNPTSFSYTQNQTIYANVHDLSYGCSHVKSFQLLIADAVSAPSGLSPQTLNPGQTLSNLEIQGQNIQWYDAAQGGNLLPGSTVAQNNVIYYASQTVNSCESKTTQASSRLPIEVHLALGTDEFDDNTFNFYPNPTSDVLTLTSNIADVKLEIFNILSQKITDKVLESGSNIINLSNFAAGVYLFQLSLDGKTRTYRIVKN